MTPDDDTARPVDEQLIRWDGDDENWHVTTVEPLDSCPECSDYVNTHEAPIVNGGARPDDEIDQIYDYRVLCDGSVVRFLREDE